MTAGTAGPGDLARITRRYMTIHHFPSSPSQSRRWADTAPPYSDTSLDAELASQSAGSGTKCPIPPFRLSPSASSRWLPVALQLNCPPTIAQSQPPLLLPSKQLIRPSPFPGPVDKHQSSPTFLESASGVDSSYCEDEALGSDLSSVAPQRPRAISVSLND